MKHGSVYVGVRARAVRAGSKLGRAADPGLGDPPVGCGARPTGGPGLVATAAVTMRCLVGEIGRAEEAL